MFFHGGGAGQGPQRAMMPAGTGARAVKRAAGRQTRPRGNQAQIIVTLTMGEQAGGGRRKSAVICRRTT